MLYLDILEVNQKRQLGFFNNEDLKFLWEDFYLAGGTGLALQVGHRMSIDFDFFSNTESLKETVKVRIVNIFKPVSITVNTLERLTFVTKDNVNITFLAYPFGLKYKLTEELHFEVASITSIASAKAYALGRRAKWKDYVDIFIYLKLFDYKNFDDIPTKQAIKSFLCKVSKRYIKQSSAD